MIGDPAFSPPELAVERGSPIDRRKAIFTIARYHA
jgi:hypothetical protein